MYCINGTFKRSIYVDYVAKCGEYLPGMYEVLGSIPSAV